MARTCIFCGAKADSYEHIFPDWIDRLIVVEGIEAERFRFESGEVQENRSYMTNRAASQRAKIVCKGCNHGWMSDLASIRQEGELSLVFG